EQRDDRRLCHEERTQTLVFGGSYPGPSRAAEGGDARVVEGVRARLGEELRVFGVGAGPAPLDVVDTEIIKAVGNAQLVLERQCQVFAVRSVTQRRVIHRDSRHTALRSLYGRVHLTSNGPPRQANKKSRPHWDGIASRGTTQIDQRTD